MKIKLFAFIAFLFIWLCFACGALLVEYFQGHSNGLNALITTLLVILVVNYVIKKTDQARLLLSLSKLSWLILMGVGFILGVMIELVNTLEGLRFLR